MKKKLLGLLITIAMSIPAYASISVAPTRLEINANKIRNNYATTAIEIKGDKTKAPCFPFLENEGVCAVLVAF